MKNLLRAAAIAVASTALVAGGSAVATAAPVAASTAATVTTTSDVSAAVAPYPLDSRKNPARITKKGKKLTFRLTVRYTDDAGRAVGIRRVTIQVLRGGKWKNLKHVKLNSKGKGTYKHSDRKKRKYRLVVKPTSLYQGGVTHGVKI